MSRMGELFPLLREYRRAIWQECLACGEDDGQAAKAEAALADIVKLVLELDQAARRE